MRKMHQDFLLIPFLISDVLRRARLAPSKMLKTSGLANARGKSA
jgi:hypothetical protein